MECFSTSGYYQHFTGRVDLKSEQVEIDGHPILKTFAANTAAHANGEFAKLLVQDYAGRIKPLSTEAGEIVNKISGTDSLYGLSAEQIVLGMNLNPALWQEIKIVKIKNDEIKKMLNLSGDYASFRDAFDANGEYKLATQVEAASKIGRASCRERV